MKYRHVSLFSGAGGLDIGLERAGFDTVWANEMNHHACETYRRRRRDEGKADVMVEGKVEKVDFSSVPDHDLATFGFPCQGFSVMGNRRVDDERNTLYRHCVRLVKEKTPRLFMAENVKGFLTLGGGVIRDKVISDFENLGYLVTVNLLCAADYGVPQERWRVIIAGLRHDVAVRRGGAAPSARPFKLFTPPAPTTPEGERVTMREALSGLPPQGDDLEGSHFSPRFMGRNRRRGWDEVSFTIQATAHSAPLWPGSPPMVKSGKKDKNGRDIYKFGDGYTRRLSAAEAAAIQTFPRGMEFCGPVRAKFTQIGNAVPCELARNLGLALREILEDDDRALAWEREREQAGPATRNLDWGEEKEWRGDYG